MPSLSRFHVARFDSISLIGPSRPSSLSADSPFPFQHIVLLWTGLGDRERSCYSSPRPRRKGYGLPTSRRGTVFGRVKCDRLSMGCLQDDKELVDDSRWFRRERHLVGTGSEGKVKGCVANRRPCIPRARGNFQPKRKNMGCSRRHENASYLCSVYHLDISTTAPFARA